jgi:hypothetical protein
VLQTYINDNVFYVVILFVTIPVEPEDIVELDSNILPWNNVNEKVLCVMEFFTIFIPLYESEQDAKKYGYFWVKHFVAESVIGTFTLM